MTRPFRVALVAVLLAASAGCGKEGGTTGPQKEPTVLGAEIGDLYLQAMEEMKAAVAPSPAPDALRPQLAALKEKYIPKFVELGRQREAMKPNDRSTCDSSAQTRMSRVPDETIAALDAYEALQGADHEFVKELDAVRRIAQYARFDQLRNALPDEAARLGLR